MKQLQLTFFLLLSFLANGQNLYMKTYGNIKEKAIVFIHGGPSGNSTLFESTTAQSLANKGFYVIIYDRRGEGRSTDENAKFTYDEAFQDLNFIYKRYHLKKAILIGHSFGGLVATLFTEKYPQKVSALVLAGALISQQETYDHILNSVGEKYTTQVNEIKKLDKKSAIYRKSCFNLASENNYFTMPNPTESSNKLRAEYEASIFYKNNVRNQNAPLLFYKNEKQNNINSTPYLKRIKASNIPIYAIYGKEDGVFSNIQIDAVRELVGKSHFALLENCSHYMFVDQQELFLSNVEKWLKKSN